MNPIPNAAMPIVAYIREDVKRPKKLPHKTSNWDDEAYLRWTTDFFGIGMSVDICPMGLCSTAMDGTPIDLREFDPMPKTFTQEAVNAFYQWWDDLPTCDALAACDAIWGKR